MVSGDNDNCNIGESFVLCNDIEVSKTLNMTYRQLSNSLSKLQISKFFLGALLTNFGTISEKFEELCK